MEDSFFFFIMDSHFIVIDVIFKVIIWEKPFRRDHLLMILLWQLTPTSSQTFSILRCAEKLCNGLQKRGDLMKLIPMSLDLFWPYHHLALENPTHCSQ